ncbi:MAG: InlB B-repeat-containing protein, partial [Clostridiales bacterium]|nr:InlB B-repeat-containing protein [Clostridiales bacterium]
NKGTTIINGGTIEAVNRTYAIYNGGNPASASLTINGGTVTHTGTSSTSLPVIYNCITQYNTTGYATVTIDGGTVTNEVANGYTISNSSGTVTISGGTISNTSSTGTTIVNSTVTNCADGSVTITGGTFYSSGTMITDSSGTVAISGGTYKTGSSGSVVDVTASVIDGYVQNSGGEAVKSQTVTSFTVYYGTTPYTIEYDSTASYNLTQAYSSTLGYGVSDGYLYAGLFTDSSYTTVVDTTEVGDGLKFYPEAGGIYYVKEISDSYLRVKCLYAWTNADGIVNLWPVTGIDDNNYKEIGFIIDDDTFEIGEICDTGTNTTNGSTVATGTEIYSTLTLTYPGGNPSSVSTTCSALFSVDGYLAVTQALDEYLSDYDDGDEITMQAYYITQDGIMVTGAFERTVTFKENFSDSDSLTYEDDDTVESVASYPKDSGSFAMVLSLEVSSNCVLTASVSETEETTYVITVHDNDTTYTQEVAEGAEVEITYAGKDGYLFAGWYTDEDYTTAADFSSIDSDMTVYAKYVSDDYMQVKVSVQSTKGVVTSLRFVSAVDSKNYAEVGFVYEYDGTEESVEVTKYSTTVSGYNAVKLFGGDVVSGSKLIYNDFSVSKISAGTEIKVTPYWVTLDGTTVYGTSRTVTYTGTSAE